MPAPSPLTHNNKSTVFTDPKGLTIHLIHNVQRVTERKAEGVPFFSTRRCLRGRGAVAHDTTPLSAPCQGLSEQKSGAERRKGTGAARDGPLNAGLEQVTGTKRLQHSAPKVLPRRRVQSRKGAPALRRSLRRGQKRRGRAGPRPVRGGARASARSPLPCGGCSSGNKSRSLRGHWELHFPVRERLRRIARYGRRSVCRRVRSRRAFEGPARKGVSFPSQLPALGRRRLCLPSSHCRAPPARLRVSAFPGPLGELGPGGLKVAAVARRRSERRTPLEPCQLRHRPATPWAQARSPTCAAG